MTEGGTPDERRRLLQKLLEQERTYPISTAQERLWFLDQLGGGALYNSFHCWHLSGELDPAALEAFLAATCATVFSARTSCSACQARAARTRRLSAVSQGALAAFPASEP